MRVGLGVALVGLVACVGCGPSPQEKAIAALRKLGASFVFSINKEVVGVDLNLNTKVTDAGLAHLKRLTKLETLYLHRTKVTDAGLVHLKGLTKLPTQKANS